MKKGSFFRTLGRRKAYVVAELFFVYLVLGIGLIMLGSVLPMLKAEYQLDYKTGGMLLSVQSVGYLAIGLLTGVLSLKIGLKRAYLILYTLFSIGLVMLLVNGAPMWLMAAMLLIGLAKGAITDYNNRVVNEYSGGNASPLNLLHAFFAIGACRAPFIVLFCTRNGNGGWRTAVIFASVLGVVSLISGFFMHLQEDSAAPTEQHAAPSTGFGFLRERLFWQTAVIGFCYQAVEASMMGWLTSFYVDTGVMGTGSAQVITSMLWVSLLIGRFSCSAIAARFRPFQMILVMCLGIAGFLTLLVCSHSLIMVLLATVGLGLCMSGMYGTSVANAGDTFVRYPISMGLFVTMTGVGAAIAPTAVGVLADRFNLRIGFSVLLIAALLLVITAFMNAHHFLKKQPQMSPIAPMKAE